VLSQETSNILETTGIPYFNTDNTASGHKYGVQVYFSLGTADSIFQNGWQYSDATSFTIYIYHELLITS